MRTRRGRPSPSCSAPDRSRSWRPAPAAPRTTSARAAKTFLEAWAGRRHRRRGEAATTDPDGGDGAARADREGPPRRGAGPAGRRRSPSTATQATVGLDRHLGPRRRPRLELRRHPATCARATTAGRSSPSRRSCTPSWGRGSTWCWPAAWPSARRSPTPPARRCSPPTEVVNVGVDPAQVTDLPALAAALSAATGVAAEEIVADVEAAPDGAVRPGHHAAPARLREDPRAGVRPARCGLPDRARGCSRPTSRFAVALLGRVGGGHRRGHRGDQRGRRRRGTPPATSSGCPGCSGPSRSSSPARPGFTVSVVSTDEGTGDQGQRDRRRSPPCPATPVQTPLVPARAERGRRRRRRADAAHAPGRRPARHRRDPRRLLERRRPTPATRWPGSSRPGSSMKTMTATALLSAGALTPDTPVPCPGTTVVDGPRVRERGPVRPRHRAATRGVRASPATRRSSSRRSKLPDGALAEAAASYGVGTDWKLPVDIFSGAVPADSTGHDEGGRRDRAGRGAR